MHELISWLAILAAGLIVTIRMTVFAMLLAIAISTLLAICSVSPWWLWRALASFYADLFRSIPLLALLIFTYYGLGALAARVGVSAFWLAVVAVAMSEAAYLGEVYRGGLLSIPQTQWEAAESLGLGWFSTVRLVVLPQALPSALPSTMNTLIGTIKNSSLASLIAVNEVTLVATILISQTFEPMQIYLVLALLYLMLITPISLFSRWLEARIGGTVAVGEDVHATQTPPEPSLPARAGA